MICDVRRLSEGIGIMLYRLLADFVIVIHCVIAWFLLFGAFLARQQPSFALLHVPLAIWVSAAFIMGWTCPLTPLENWFRKAVTRKAATLFRLVAHNGSMFCCFE